MNECKLEMAYAHLPLKKLNTADSDKENNGNNNMKVKVKFIIP